jgi:hypothetical protein
MFHRFVFLMILAVLFSIKGFSQSDTLHIYYRGIETKVQDSTEAKIAKWAKSLNGKKVDIEVISYYSDAQFKKYSVERCDELSLIINRKARDLINVKFIGPKKGVKSLRTRADIVYTPQGTAPAPIAEEKKKTEKEIKTTGTSVAAVGAAENKKTEKAPKEEKKNEKSAKKEEAKSTAEKKEKPEDLAKEEKKDKNKKKEEKKTENKGENKESDKKEAVNEEESAEEKAAEASGKYPAKRNSPKIGVDAEDVALVKSARIILTTASNTKENDKLLRNAVKNFWTFNQNISVLPYDSAADLAKKDPNILLMFITKIVTETATHSSGKSIEATTRGVMLEKGKKKPVYTAFFPLMEGAKPVTQEMVNFAVSAMNCLFVNMDAQGIKKMRNMNVAFEKDSKELKDRTLLITSTLLSKKVEPTEIANLYHGKFEVVDYAQLADAINNRKPYAYVLPVPYNVGGQIRYYDYLMDAESGKVYYIKSPSSAPVLSIPDPLGNVHDVGNSNRINAKDLEKYNKAFEKKEGKEKDEAEEEKSKETQK